MVDTAEKFYAKFFKNGEGIAFQSRFAKDDGGWWAKNNIRLQAPGMVSAIDFEYNNFCINPIDPYHDNNPENVENRNKPRVTKANVTAYRGMLIECDNLSPKQQTIRMNKSGMPYSAKIFSGNNSYHYTIFFDRDLTQEEYYATFEAIKNALVKYNYVLDDQCKSPNKLTRAPFCKREITGAEQTLVECKEVVRYTDMLAWLKTNRIDITPVSKAIKENNKPYSGPGNADEKFRWEDAVSRNIFWNHDYGLSARQPWLYELGKQCKANGLDQATALRLAQENYEHDEPHKIVTGINNGYTYGNLTPRTLDKPERIETTPGLQLSTATDQEFNDFRNGQRPEGYQSIFRVNNDFFQLLPDGSHIQKTVSTLKIDFGDNAHSTLPRDRKYDAFGWRPNLLEDERTLVENGVRKFNTFVSPKIKLREGVTEDDIPYSLHMMKRIWHGGSEDMYEFGLDYQYVTLFMPDEKLPNLVLAGPPSSGKTEFGKNQLRITTGKLLVDLIDGKDLLNNFNAHTANAWIKVFDEVKLPKGSEVADNVKRMITADTNKIEAKGKDVYYIPNFSRMIFTTNHISNFLTIEPKEDRYIVRLIEEVTDEDEKNYPDYQQNLIKEANDFVSYIYYRGLKVVPKKAGKRFWFKLEQYDTAALRSAKESSKSDLEIAVEEILEDMFEVNKELDVAYVRVQSMRNQLEKLENLKEIKITNGVILGIMSKLLNTVPIKTKRTDSLDGELLNTRFFEIQRNVMISDKPKERKSDTTPGVSLPNFEEVEENSVDTDVCTKTTTATSNLDDYLRNRKQDEFFDIFNAEVPVPIK